jgi:hypothetical protein
MAVSSGYKKSAISNPAKRGTSPQLVPPTAGSEMRSVGRLNSHIRIDLAIEDFAVADLFLNGSDLDFAGNG